MKGSIVEKNKCFVSTVIYIHDRSKEEVTHFCDTVIRKLADSFENNEVIFVCDDHGMVGEKDITQILKSLELNVLAETVQMAYYQGIEASMCAGDDLAIGDFLFEFDNIDVDYNPDLVLEVFEKARSGYDIVSAGDDSMSIGSRVFYRLMNHSRSYEVRHESFRVVSRRAVNRIKILNNTIPYRKVSYAACGLPTAYVHYEPVKGVKKHKLNRHERSYRVNAGMDYTMIYTKAVEKLTFALSALFLLVTIATGVWAIYSYLVEDNVVGGWVSLMGVISFGFFGVFLLISVMIKYMSLILEANYKKEAYVVESANKN